MESNTDKTKIPDEIITSKIYVIRDIKVMLDEDPAELYNVTTGNLNKAAKRNATRFPEDFMFQLTKKEFSDLQFQIGRASWGGRRTPPIAFTEKGVAMLSGVLHSERAIIVNTQIMRVFTRMREMLETHKEFLRKLDNLERKDIEQDKKIILIFEYLKKLELAKQKELRQHNPKRVGFKRKDEN